ncbi:MAG: phosphoribosyltransferase, partial [Hymenobacteraceae bacterium]|nr:phosphoribosyltransferase [Hymenobacteraceae bacterium]MDX5395178.1 phosphoribosyltransferase [Hymenobacteraceae bacterium]MDX5511215.1 phosphoribosyltransferase [Hymenobacteraceae bacterium]
MIKDRQDAAERLAIQLQHHKGENGVVLTIPRGGVPIGVYIAKQLNMPVEVILSKKIGHPTNPEFAIGSVSMDSVDVNEKIPVSKEYLEETVENIREELKRRYKVFMGDKKPADLEGKTVIIVDDGIATGHTLMATIELVKKKKPGKVVVAVPVAPPSAIEKLQTLVDEVICLMAPPDF